MIRRSLLVTAAVTFVLYGCSSVPKVNPSEYRLPLLNEPTVQFCSAAARQVVVSDLMLSDGILLQRSETQIHAARHHRWSGTLEQQLQQSAQRWLSQSGCGGTVVITVMDFYGDSDGRAVVSGHWHYQNGDQQLKSSFSRRQALTADGYDALVTALNTAWHETLLDIREALSN